MIENDYLFGHESLFTCLSSSQSWLAEVEGKHGSRGERRPSADVNHHTPHGRERSGFPDYIICILNIDRL